MYNEIPEECLNPRHTRSTNWSVSSASTEQIIAL